MIVVIGGGPAGFFAAIAAREQNPSDPVLLLEKHRDVLRKVVVSGGGRCNVTHNCSDPREMAKYYPRGGRELIGAFHRFAPQDTIEWFAERGVELKTEPDGRMFPISDSSATIVETLMQAASQCGVELRTRCGVKAVRQGSQRQGFAVELADGSTLNCDKILIATGGQTSGDGTGGLGIAQSLGHSVIDPVPSLFTFKIQDPLLENLAGVAVSQVGVKAVGPGLPAKGLSESGPMLVTHWGLSGPAILRLSAWGARALFDVDYQFLLRVDWCPGQDRTALDKLLAKWGETNGRKQVSQRPDIGVPRRLWEALLEKCGISRERKWAELGKKNRNRLLEVLKNTELQVFGKSLNKEEFVTCGGVCLSEVDFKSMQSRLVPGLFFAGEVLDIDGITGGFNFQGCWTTGCIAGKGM